MSPILVRPVREQLEHDRVIRLLQAKYKRKFEVAINPGHEQTAGVGNPEAPWFPDLVLHSQERGRKLVGTVEVETTESVNHLEAMSEWATFSRLRAAFHLYVPTGCIDSARRLCAELGVTVAEFWAYQSIGDQIRFTLVQRSAAATAAESKARAAEAAEKTETPKPASRAARPAGRNGAASAARPGPPSPARRSTTAARRPAAAKTAKPASRRTAATKATGRKTATRSQKRR